MVAGGASKTIRQVRTLLPQFSEEHVKWALGQVNGGSGDYNAALSAIEVLLSMPSEFAKRPPPGGGGRRAGDPEPEPRSRPEAAVRTAGTTSFDRKAALRAPAAEQELSDEEAAYGDEDHYARQDAYPEEDSYEQEARLDAEEDSLGYEQDLVYEDDDEWEDEQAERKRSANAFREEELLDYMEEDFEADRLGAFAEGDPGGQLSEEEWDDGAWPRARGLGQPRADLRAAGRLDRRQEYQRMQAKDVTLTGAICSVTRFHAMLRVDDHNSGYGDLLSYIQEGDRLMVEGIDDELETVVFRQCLPGEGGTASANGFAPAVAFAATAPPPRQRRAATAGGRADELEQAELPPHLGFHPEPRHRTAATTASTRARAAPPKATPPWPAPGEDAGGGGTRRAATASASLGAAPPRGFTATAPVPRREAEARRAPAAAPRAPPSAGAAALAVPRASALKAPRGAEEAKPRRKRVSFSAAV